MAGFGIKGMTHLLNNGEIREYITEWEKSIKSGTVHNSVVTTKLHVLIPELKEIRTEPLALVIGLDEGDTVFLVKDGKCIPE